MDEGGCTSNFLLPLLGTCRTTTCPSGGASRKARPCGLQAILSKDREFWRRMPRPGGNPFLRGCGLRDRVQKEADGNLSYTRIYPSLPHHKPIQIHQSISHNHISRQLRTGLHRIPHKLNRTLRIALIVCIGISIKLLKN